MKKALVMLFLAFALVACVPEPEDYVLEKREPSKPIEQEIQEIEQAAKELAREKIEAQQAAEAAKPEEDAPEPERKDELIVGQTAAKSGTMLALYPFYFMDGDAFKSNFVTVVGGEAPSSYVVAVANLVARTQGTKPVGFSMLDTDISDIASFNAIVVGNACNNDVIRKMFGNPTPCDNAPLPEGKGLIRLYEAANGNLALVAAGKTEIQVLSAINAISSEKLAGVSGSEICVQSQNLVSC